LRRARRLARAARALVRAAAPLLDADADADADATPPPALICTRRPRGRCSGRGIGTVTSSTPSLNAARTCSSFTCSGSGIARWKAP
jgi:hypothetical protein